MLPKFETFEYLNLVLNGGNRKRLKRLIAGDLLMQMVNFMQKYILLY